MCEGVILAQRERRGGGKFKRKDREGREGGAFVLGLLIGVLMCRR
jgi:hypothetical protein